MSLAAGATCQRASSCPNMSMSPTLLSAKRRPGLSTRCSINWRVATGRVSWNGRLAHEKSHGCAMNGQQRTPSGEDRLIARYFKPLARNPGAFGLEDDAAALTPPPGCDLVLTA